MVHQRIQDQFGPNALHYAASPVHARGASLQRLVEATSPQPSWMVLDVATGTGHTAFAFAPHVARVVALDLTLPMIQAGAALAREQNHSNVSWVGGDAEHLPWAEGSFDLVTCRIAPHHFADVGAFVREAARVLKPSGILGVVDNIVPGSRRRGKAATRARRAGDYVNAFEKLRDPSHGRCLSQAEWIDLFAAAGFTIDTQELLGKTLHFDTWTTRMNVSASDRHRLRAMLLQAPEDVAAFLTPHSSGDRIQFRLTELLIVGR